MSALFMHKIGRESFLNLFDLASHLEKKVKEKNEGEPILQKKREKGQKEDDKTLVVMRSTDVNVSCNF
jgi:hypothetical protein